MTKKMDDSGELFLEVVADRALVAQTRLGEDYRVGVEWEGRCWVWLTAGEAPSLMEVVVSEAEVAKLLEPGQVRRVRARSGLSRRLRERSMAWNCGRSSGRSLNRTSERQPEGSGREGRSVYHRTILGLMRKTR